VAVALVSATDTSDIAIVGRIDTTKEETPEITEGRPTAAAVVRDVIAEPTGASTDPDAEATPEPDESDVISLADTVISLGRSSSDGSQSHSTCGSLVSANSPIPLCP